MENKKLIAEALLEIAKRSETTFLEVGKEDKELIAAAKKIGITLPSPDLMVMKTVYAEIDKVNLNGVILPKKAAKAGLNTLIGKQCNWEHNGCGFVCGYTISAKINENKIETINVLFKSLFPEQADELKEKVKSGEAAVSFEIWNKNPDTGKSVVKELDNGYREISPIIYHGTGILLINQPACPIAKIFKLVAKKELEEAEKIVNKVFSEDLIYAQMAIETEESSYECKCLKCGKIISSDKHCKDIKCPACGGDMRRKDKPGVGQPTQKSKENSEKEVDKVDKEEKKIEDNLPKETKIEEKAAETKTEKVDETKAGETKIEETKKEEKVEAEAKTEEKKEEVAEEKKEEKVEETEAKTEEKPEEKKEEVAEEKAEESKTEEKKEEAQPLETIEPKIIVKVTRIYSETTIDTYVDGTPSGTQEVKGHSKKITEYKDGTKDEVSEDVDIKKKYDFAELEEAVKKSEEELIAALPKEVTDCVKKKTKDGKKPADAVKECWKEYKEKQAKAMADVAGEKDKEITKLKEELGTKDQEIADLKNPKVEEKKETEMTVGAVETETKSEVKKQADNINQIIANKRK